MTEDIQKPTTVSLGTYLLHHLLREEGVRNASYHGFSNKMQVHLCSGRTLILKGPPTGDAAVTAVGSKAVQEAIKLMVERLREATALPPTEEEEKEMASTDTLTVDEALSVHDNMMSALKTIGRTITEGLYESSANTLQLKLNDDSILAVGVKDGGRLSVALVTREKIIDILADLKKRVDTLEREMTPEQREQKMEKDG